MKFKNKTASDKNIQTQLMNVSERERRRGEKREREIECGLIEPKLFHVRAHVHIASNISMASNVAHISDIVLIRCYAYDLIVCRLRYDHMHTVRSISLSPRRIDSFSFLYFYFYLRASVRHDRMNVFVFTTWIGSVIAGWLQILRLLPSKYVTDNFDSNSIEFVECGDI